MPEQVAPEQTAPQHITYVSFSAEISQQTMETLLGITGDLAKKKVSTVCLMLSTPGGGVMQGMTIYNVLRALPFKLITHNVGNVDSIGNMVFLAGDERYSSPHSTFMFHGVGFDVNSPIRLDEKMLRERTNSITADQERMAAILSERTRLQTDEINALFLESATKDPNYALANGIIHGIREIKIPDGAPFLQLVFKR